MAIYQQSEGLMGPTSPADMAADDGQSMRQSMSKQLWITVFTLLGIGTVIISSGLSAMAAMVAGLTVAYVLAADIWPDKIGSGSKFYQLVTVSLAVALFWISVLAGSSLVEMLGLENSGFFIASVISVAVYAGLIFSDFALAIAVQVFVSKKQ